MHRVNFKGKNPIPTETSTYNVGTKSRGAANPSDETSPKRQHRLISRNDDLPDTNSSTTTGGCT